MISSDSAIDQRIVTMRKEGGYILTIHKWLSAWDNFSQLDEQIVLCHICRILNNANLAISRNEVRKCFNKFYNIKYHGEKKSYLNWIYQEFKVKNRTRVFTPQVRKKSPIPQISGHKSPILSGYFERTIQTPPKALTGFDLAKKKESILNGK